MSASQAEHPSRKRSHVEECDDNDIEVVEVKKKKPDGYGRVLSPGFITEGLWSFFSRLRGNPVVDGFTRSVISAFSNNQFTMFSSGGDVDSLVEVQIGETNDKSQRLSSQKHEIKWQRNVRHYSPLIQRSESFITIGEKSGGEQVISAKAKLERSKSAFEMEVVSSSPKTEFSKWSVGPKSTSKHSSHHPVHAHGRNKPEVVDLTAANGYGASSRQLSSRRTAKDEPDVQFCGEVTHHRNQYRSGSSSARTVENGRKPLNFSTPDIQFIRTTAYGQTSLRKARSNGVQKSREFSFSGTMRSHQFGLEYSSHHSTLSRSRQPSPRSTSFTANEVIRMQEKEQYKMLVDHFVYRFEPVAAAVKPDSKSAGTQVDAERDIDPAFFKETLSEYESKLCRKNYDKPCKLVKQTEYVKPKHPQRTLDEPKEEVILDDDDDDDEPLIIETKRTTPRPLPTSRFFSQEWVEDLKRTVCEETEERKKIVQDQERQIAEYKAKRAAKYAEFLKREKLKQLKPVIPETITVDKEELPEITPEMDAIIENSLIPTLSSEVVLSKVNEYGVTRKDLETLCGLNWLNDEVINFYLALIVERSKQKSYPSVYAFSSFFFPSLKTKGYAAVRRWTRKVDIFSYDINLVPLHFGVHWCLAVIDYRYKKIQYYDSMLGKETCLETLRDYLVKESLDKKKQEFDLTGWTLEKMTNIPPQMNGSDCGMFTLKYAEYVTRDAQITFTQQNMPYFRRRMVYEIMTRKIL